MNIEKLLKLGSPLKRDKMYKVGYMIDGWRIFDKSILYNIYNITTKKLYKIIEVSNNNIIISIY